MPTVQLLFDDNLAYAGATLEGAIKIGLKQPHELTEVYLTLEGKQEVRLLETKTEYVNHNVPVVYYDGSTGLKRTQIHQYTTSHTYTVPHEHSSTLMNDRITLRNSPELLQPGENYIRFSIQLPENLPATHNEPQINLRQSGYNAYTALAMLRLNHTVYSCKSSFMVHQAVGAPEPIQKYREFEIGMVCCFWDGGSLNVQAGAAKDTFCPNEAISIDLLVKRQGKGVDFTGGTISLHESVEYCSGSYSHPDTQVISKVSIPSIKKGLDFQSSFLLQVPADFEPETTSAGIKVTHFLQIELSSNWTSNKIMYAPVQLYYQGIRIDRTGMVTPPVSIASNSVASLKFSSPITTNFPLKN